MPVPISRGTKYPRLFLPGGTLTPVTRDASNYTAISVARRVPLLAAVASEERWRSNLCPRVGERLPTRCLARPMRISVWPGCRTESWSRTKDYRLHAIDPETGDPSDLRTDPGCATRVLESKHAEMCRVVYMRYSPKPKKVSVWSRDAAGQNPRKLTPACLGSIPRCSPDMRWVYFFDSANPAL